MVKPALQPVGVWDPQAPLITSHYHRIRNWDSEVWDLFLKLSPLQDTPSTFRIAWGAEYEGPAAMWAETNYGDNQKSVKDSLIKGWERFFNFLEMSPLFPVKEPQSLALLPPKCQILLFYCSLVSAIHTSYFCPAGPLEAGSIAEVSGRLLILAGCASLLFLLPMYSFPPAIFPFLQRLNRG